MEWMCLLYGVGGALLTIPIHWWLTRSSKTAYTPTPKIDQLISRKYQVTVTSPQGLLQFWQISSSHNRKDVPYAWALVESDPLAKVCFLWMIYVREDIRGQGYGRDMIGLLQEKFDLIRSHYTRGLVSKPGTKLCMKCGFVMKQAMHKRQPNELVWRKEK